MKKLAIISCLLLSWSYAGNSLAADAAAGKTKSAACTACHGADGNSAAPTFPKLAGQGEKYLLKQLRDIRDGARPIPAMTGQLNGKTDEDLADIAAYYSAQARSGSHTKPELADLGAQVYRAAVAERGVPACSACHSPNGKGNAPAGYPALAGQHAEYIETQLRAYRKGYEDAAGRTNDGDAKIMRTIAFGLSDGQLTAVASYAAGLK